MVLTSAAQAATTAVANGGDFQKALNDARPGDVITGVAAARRRPHDAPVRGAAAEDQIVEQPVR